MTLLIRMTDAKCFITLNVHIQHKKHVTIIIMCCILNASEQIIIMIIIMITILVIIIMALLKAYPPLSMYTAG